MKTGEEILQGIIQGDLLHAQCSHDPAHNCVVVWSSAAAEQIEAIACEGANPKRCITPEMADRLFELMEKCSSCESQNTLTIYAGDGVEVGEINFILRGHDPDSHRHLFKKS